MTKCNKVFFSNYSSLPVFGGFRVAHPFSVLCCPIMPHYVLNSILYCPLRNLHKNDVRFVLACSCLQEESYLIAFFCICLRIVMSNILTSHIFLRTEFLVVMSATISVKKKRWQVSLYFQLFAGLIYVICLCLRIVVSNTY